VNAGPYRKAASLAAAHRRAAEGPGPPWVRLGLALLAAGAGAWLARPLFLGFLDEGARALASGTEAVVLRAGLVVVGVASLDAYGRLLRGDDRGVWSLLPVDPVAVTWQTLRANLQDRAGVPVLGAVVLLPLGWEGSWTAWAAAVVALVGMAVFSWPAAYTANLLAVGWARSAAWAPMLDLVRGAYPREQAAFIYTPGLLLLASGGVVAAAARGAGASAYGWTVSSWWLVLPFAAALLAVAPLGRLARGAWFTATTVLSDIDGRWAAIQQGDPERLHVYLDWAIRFLPALWRRDALLDLRHGWRGRRTWLTSAWLGGLVGPLTALAVPDGGAQAMALAAVVAAGVVSVHFVLESDEPSFLRWWLPRPPGAKRAARAAVLAAWAQPAVGPVVLAVTWREGWLPGIVTFVLLEVEILFFVAFVLVAAALGPAARWAYPVLAAGVVGAAYSARWLGGGG
jgi:hypothetical protein